jgi:hypothetical protein
MTLEDLGNIGEFLGAIGVVVSLVYLALQIRLNSRSIQASSYQSMTSHLAELNRVVVESPEIARILDVGSQDLTNLSAEERSRFELILVNRLRHFETLHYHYVRGLLEEPVWQAYRNVLGDILNSPGAAATRNASSGRGSPAAFLAEVESIQHDAEPREGAV